MIFVANFFVFEFIAAAATVSHPGIIQVGPFQAGAWDKTSGFFRTIFLKVIFLAENESCAIACCAGPSSSIMGFAAHPCWMSPTPSVYRRDGILLAGAKAWPILGKPDFVFPKIKLAIFVNEVPVAASHMEKRKNMHKLQSLR